MGFPERPDRQAKGLLLGYVARGGPALLTLLGAGPPECSDACGGSQAVRPSRISTTLYVRPRVPSEGLTKRGACLRSFLESVMESLVIHAASRESAEAFCSALSEFDPRLVEGDDGRCQVEVPVERSNKKILAALSALEAYVSTRAEGPARLDVQGQRYTLHPTDASPPPT
jgi:hypothetical protein